MRNGFRIGRVFGIELRIDSSWVLILVLVVWSLSSLFAAWHPDWSPGTTFVVALLAAVAFFGSVLFHELAHSLVARLYGIPVRDITLHMFGGVSSIEREPPTPGSEFLIAVVGPISSVVLGIAMLLLGAYVSGMHGLDTTTFDTAEEVAAHMGPLTTLLMWLGPVNIIVGLFNLIPGFPLDGGRILRSALWKATGDLSRATRHAAQAGQLVGWTFIVMGAFMALGFRVPIFGRGLGSGIWLVLIGFFLKNAAAQHQVSAALQDALTGMRVADLMRTQGPWVPATEPLSGLARGWFLRHDERAVPVFQDGAFVGMVTITDLRSTPSPEWQQRTVRDVMTPRGELTVAAPDEQAFEALRKLGASGVGQLPVVDGGLLVGLLHERDIARWLELESRRPRPITPRHA